MKSGDIYKRRFDNIYIQLLEKIGGDWTCLIIKNDLVPEIEGTRCTLAEWIIVGRDWVLQVKR